MASIRIPSHKVTLKRKCILDTIERYYTSYCSFIFEKYHWINPSPPSLVLWLPPPISWSCLIIFCLINNYFSFL
ncbi:Os09g0472000 [Oryza sativa Japonica Group]|uniref:Os09g0472000 protein n=1 Tax=Oryza sativa subsp. japonica TaxID=39947 RepID=A0A0P0XND0_ORYSJ|nr:hypothetical protein EE612_048458 [Oryza sativa]BAT08568.1 Os09g0472000 [Oryza sativa Japonica Group]